MCRSVSQYHLLDAWRNSLDPAPKIGLLIAEEEGQNLSKSFVIHQVSIRYRTTQRCQRCFVSFSLLQSGAFFFAPPFFYCRLGSNVHDHVAAVACEVVDATLTGPQPGVLNAIISIIYRRKFRKNHCPQRRRCAQTTRFVVVTGFWFWSKGSMRDDIQTETKSRLKHEKY